MKLKNSLLLLILSLSLLVAVSGTSGTLQDMISEESIRQAAKIKTLREIGTLEMGGMKGQAEILFAAPDRIWFSFDLGVLRIAQAFDGKTAWMKDQNGQSIELTGNDKKRIISTAYATGFSYLLNDRMPGQVNFVKDTLIENQSYGIFMAVPEGGDPSWLFMNKQTGRIEITREFADEIPVLTYISDFRVVDGVEFGFKYKSESPLPQLNSTIEFTKIEKNIPIPDSVFWMSGVISVDYYFPDTADSVTVPIDYQNGHIYIGVKIGNQKEVYFILDSGAGVNLLNKDFAARLNLKTFGDIAAKGVGGYESASMTEIDTLSIGDIKLFGQKTAVVELSDLKLSAPGELGGLMGYDLLSRFPFKINYMTSQLTFYNPARFTPPDSQLAIDMEFVMKIPAITAEIDGHGGKFLVDIGNSLGLILHKSLVDRYNLKAGFTDIKEMTGGIGGIGGQSRAWAAVGGMFRLGPAEIKRPPLLIADSESGVFKSSELDGNIGNLMLQEFSILIDYRDRKLYILPRSKM